jgi:hypothetical protein
MATPLGRSLAKRLGWLERETRRGCPLKHELNDIATDRQRQEAILARASDRGHVLVRELQPDVRGMEHDPCDECLDILGLAPKARALADELPIGMMVTVRDALVRAYKGEAVEFDWQASGGEGVYLTKEDGRITLHSPPPQ